MLGEPRGSSDGRGLVIRSSPNETFYDPVSSPPYTDMRVMSIPHQPHTLGFAKTQDPALRAGTVVLAPTHGSYASVSGRRRRRGPTNPAATACGWQFVITSPDLAKVVQPQEQFQEHPNDV